MFGSNTLFLNINIIVTINFNLLSYFQDEKYLEPSSSLSIKIIKIPHLLLIFSRNEFKVNETLTDYCSFTDNSSESKKFEISQDMLNSRSADPEESDLNTNKVIFLIVQKALAELEPIIESFHREAKIIHNISFTLSQEERLAQTVTYS
jgi:hypothetical protein